ncbi:MAG TPA: hypothetical protein VFA74_09710 [Terriglobales bacterium]|nr:hypothetical protein [Terriglobales bacterium]
MDFFSKLLQGIAFLPAIITGIENFFANHSGREKQAAAISFIQAAISMGDAVTNRQITGEAKFKDGLSQIVNGIVECLNASSWAKAAK